MTSLISPILDPFGRPITYLRVSVTDRCDFRCVYCMAEDMTFLPKSELMTLEETETLCRRFMAVGTRKIRLTGVSLWYGAILSHLSAIWELKSKKAILMS